MTMLLFTGPAAVDELSSALQVNYPTSHLAMFAAFLEEVCTIQETRTRRLRAWLASPSSPNAVRI